MISMEQVPSYLLSIKVLGFSIEHELLGKLSDYLSDYYLINYMHEYVI